MEVNLAPGKTLSMMSESYEQSSAKYTLRQKGEPLWKFHITNEEFRALKVDEQADFLDNETLRVRYVEIMY